MKFIIGQSAVFLLEQRPRRRRDGEGEEKQLIKLVLVRSSHAHLKGMH